MISIALNQLKIINFKEPFEKFINVGLVRAKSYKLDGNYITPEQALQLKSENVEIKIEKMSKSKLNGISPSIMIEKYGVDATRLYVLYCAKVEDGIIWNEAGVKGMQRFLMNLKRLSIELDFSTLSRSTSIFIELSETFIDLTKIQQLFNESRFNLAVTELIKALKVVEKTRNVDDYALILKLLYPMCPTFCFGLLNDLKKITD